MRRTALGVAIAAAILLCCLPIITVLSDQPDAYACTGTPARRPSDAQPTARTNQPLAPIGRWSPAQVGNAAIIVAVGQRNDIPPRGWVIAVATAMTESSLTNHTNPTDHDSLGLFQQRPSQGWGTPAQLIQPDYAAKLFFAALLRVPNWQAIPLTEAAQAVQRSAFPLRYATFEHDAETAVAALTGVSAITDLPGASLIDCTPPGPESATGWTKPVNAGVVSGFRTAARPDHHGVDLGAARHTVIRAAAAGTVVWAGCDASTGNCDIDGSPTTPGCGWFVEIIHPGNTATRYCHFQRRPDVHPSETVLAGQPIGIAGTSGRSSGPHLHFEVHVNVTCATSRCDLSRLNAVDPEQFMRGNGAALGLSRL